MPLPSAERVQQLRSAVPLAFQRELPPPPSQMTADGCAECDALAESLRGREWSSLSPAEVDALRSAVGVMSARALRCYMPAIILRAIDRPAAPVVSALVARLVSADDPALTSAAHRRTLSSTRRELRALLRPDQMGVVRAFLEWACAYPALRESARAALEGLVDG